MEPANHHYQVLGIPWKISSNCLEVLTHSDKEHRGPHLHLTLDRHRNRNPGITSLIPQRPRPEDGSQSPPSCKTDPRSWEEVLISTLRPSSWVVLKPCSPPCFPAIASSTACQWETLTYGSPPDLRPTSLPGTITWQSDQEVIMGTEFRLEPTLPLMDYDISAIINSHNGSFNPIQTNCPAGPVLLQTSFSKAGWNFTSLPLGLQGSCP